MNQIESSAQVEDSMPSNIMTDEELARTVEQHKKTSWLFYLFPILRKEWHRLGIMIIMLSIIAFCYTFLRLFKDRVIYSVLDNDNTKNYLKLLTFVVTQILVVVAQNISSKTNFNNAFRNITILSAILMAVNGVLMACSGWIQPNEIMVDSLFVSYSLDVRWLGPLYPLLLIFNQFSFSCFYILAEVLGSMMVSFCFMTYVNNNTSENQNKRFIKTLYFFSNICSLAASLIFKSWNEGLKKMEKLDTDRYYLIFPLCVSGLYLVVLFFKYLLEKEFENQIVAISTKPKKTESKKKSIGFRDSIYLMFNSRLLLCMSGLSLFYNISSNLFDITNTNGMSATAKYYNEDKSVYSSKYKSCDGMITAIGTALIVLSPLSLLTETLGMKCFAIVPLVVVFVSIFFELFFAMVNVPITGNECVWPFNLINLGCEPLPAAEPVVGTAIQIAIKISKYAFFDVVKEAVAMKIEPALRPLFKGVCDGSMAKFGKCAGAIYGILMSVFFIEGDSRCYFPITAILLLIFCVCWYLAIQYLNRSYNEAAASGTYMNPDMSEKINF